MNRTLKEASVRRYHYETQAQLREQLEAFLNAYNFAKRLKTLRGLTPYEHICKAWADQLKYDPTHPEQLASSVAGSSGKAARIRATSSGSVTSTDIGVVQIRRGASSAGGPASAMAYPHPVLPGRLG